MTIKPRIRELMAKYIRQARKMPVKGRLNIYWTAYELAFREYLRWDDYDDGRASDELWARSNG